VIKRIERLKVDGNATPSQSLEQHRLLQKFPKWFIKTFESVRRDEVGNTRIIISTKQDDEGDVDNSDSCDVNVMNVSYGCELNLSTNNEPPSFEEVASHYEWKEAMQKEYDALK
jgi:hypothetical protein